MSTNLTETFIKNKIQEVQRKSKKQILSDERNKNLIVEVRPTGSATYFFRYRDSDNNIRHLKIAKFKQITLKDARSVAQEKHAKIVSGENPNPQEDKTRRRDCPTLKDFFNKVYMPYSRANKKNPAVDQQLIGKHVLPIFGNRKLVNIKKNDVERLLEKLVEKNLQPASRKRILATLSHVFTIAIERETSMVSDNPVKKVRKPKVNNEKERILSKDEIDVLLRTAKEHKHPHLYNILKLLVLTGARRSEVLNARFSQFNLNERVWYVNGKNGPRKVMLPNSAVELIRNLQTTAGADLLFPKPGTFNEPYKCINDPFKRVLRKAGLDNSIRIHDLRHTFASLTLKSGAGLPEVQKLLGHSSITTTMRYIHLQDKELKEYSNAVAEKIDG